MPVKASEHFSAKIPPHIFETLMQAAELEGATVKQFLIRAAFEKAQEVIEKEGRIQMSCRSAETFFAAIENPPEPAAKLIEAAKKYKKVFPDA
ncbi:MAG: DUF1778 domain-containing protein [Desulfococcaceae bacterium]|jgi:uncharacterized protein (DUF1778 family)|nr:DUF1778 domain-containing protein [Desulfococcaceae bacterium]